MGSRSIVSKATVQVSAPVAEQVANALRNKYAMSSRAMLMSELGLSDSHVTDRILSSLQIITSQMNDLTPNMFGKLVPDSNISVTSLPSGSRPSSSNIELLVNTLMNEFSAMKLNSNNDDAYKRHAAVMYTEMEKVWAYYLAYLKE